MGFSAEELAAKNAEAINGAAAAAKNVSRAIGLKASNGVVPGVESGVVQAERANAATSPENNLNNREAQITDEGYQVQREAFDTAVRDKEASLGASFNPATSIQGGVTAANETMAAQANANESASTSWMGMVGGLADAAAGGLTSGLFKPKNQTITPTPGGGSGSIDPNAGSAGGSQTSA